MLSDDQREARIRERAYLISNEPDAGTPEENWLRAEREIAAEEADALRRATVERGKEVGMLTAYTHP
jgi:hypothetical protein